MAVDRSSSRATAGDSKSGRCCCCFFFLKVRKLKKGRKKTVEAVDIFSTGKFGGVVVRKVDFTVLTSDKPGECRGMLDALSLLAPPRSRSSARFSSLCVCAYRDVADADLIRNGGKVKAETNLDLRAEWVFSRGNGSSSSPFSPSFSLLSL